MIIKQNMYNINLLITHLKSCIDYQNLGINYQE